MEPSESKLSALERAELSEHAHTAIAEMLDSRKGIIGGLAGVTADEAKQFFKQGLRAPPELTIRILRNYVDLLRKRAGGKPIDDEEVAYRLGYLCAMAIEKLLGWELVFLKSKHMQRGEVAVVSKERNYAAYPAPFVYRLLAEPARDNTLALTVNMLLENAGPPAAAKSYAIVMG